MTPEPDGRSRRRLRFDEPPTKKGKSKTAAAKANAKSNAKSGGKSGHVTVNKHQSAKDNAKKEEARRLGRRRRREESRGTSSFLRRAPSDDSWTRTSSTPRTAWRA